MAYDLAPVKAPRLAGAGLRLVAWLLESSLFSRLLLPRLLADMGVLGMRRRVNAARPTFLPWSEPDAAARARPALELPGLERLVSAAAPSQSPGKSAQVREYRRAYQEGKSSPEVVAEGVLRSIEHSNEDRSPPLRAIIACDEEDVRRQARASAERWRRGAPLSLLDGVPVAVKDELDQVPYPTTAGTRLFGGEPARSDATAIARLRAAGALLVGKANMHEMGLGVTGMNPHTGFCRNPWDPGRATGGSSSGPGAAVASGLVPIAIGADGGGSIRIPAALCGVVGLKPTFGRVSEHGAFPICWSLAHVGPLAGSALDCAIAYAVFAGPDALDPVAARGPPVHLQSFTTDLAGLRLGVYRPWFRDAEAEVVSVCEQMLAHLEQQGAEVHPIEIPDLEPLRVAHALTILIEIASALEAVYAGKQESQLSAETRINIAIARGLSGRDYLQAQRIRTESIAHFRQALDRVDVVVTPTTGCLAPPIRADTLSYGESDLVMLSDLMRFVVAANFTGLPAISFPAGFAGSGLPVGMQAIGRWWDEHVLLRLAHAAESGVEPRRPTVHYEPATGQQT